MGNSNKVFAKRINQYSCDLIFDQLPDEIFNSIKRGATVVLKPNWVCESHKYRVDDWEYVITHPDIVTAVLRKVLVRLDGSGTVVILDGPTTETFFSRLISRYPVTEWKAIAEKAFIRLEIFDLRDHEWITRHGIIVKRNTLIGDPKGKVLVNLTGEESEFWGHRGSSRTYYGADYNHKETNWAHDGYNNLYSVSRTVLEADVFINLPKLKTHRKTGITACLKNLVGINTYKNYLPHYSEGGPSAGGDQFPEDIVSARVEGPLVRLIKQYILQNPFWARYVSPLSHLGRRVFGDDRQVIRSGNWFGNDTIWRMVLDLNKVLLYSNPDGTLRLDDFILSKSYIGIVDAILAGEGHGPLAPEPVEMGYIFCGINPIAVDAVCCAFMGFDALKIPSIANSFLIRRYPLCDFNKDDIEVYIEGSRYSLEQLPTSYIIPFEPQFGWKGHIEREV